MNPKKTKLFSLLPLLLALFPDRFDLHAQIVDPTVEFEFDSLEMNEASSMTICLELTNAVLDSEEYKVEIYFKGSSLPHFAGQQRRIISFQEKKYCFSIHASMHHTSVDDAEYELDISVLSPPDMDPGDHDRLTILVENVNPEKTALGVKSLAFVAYDNQITSGGSDRIALMNTVPIVSQTAFTLTSVEYDSTAGLKQWHWRNSSPISALKITYTGSATIPVASVIEFTIEHHATNGDQLINFEINNNSSGSFSISNVGDDPTPDLDMSTSAGNSLYIVDGEYVEDGDFYTLLGTAVDGIHVGYSAPPDLPPGLDNNSVIVTQTGSSWGIIDCDGKIYLCDFIALVGDVTEWTIQSGTTANNLPADILNSICGPEECPTGEVNIEADCIASCTDYIFLVDKSASVSETEYAQMYESISNTIFDIDATNIDAQYAVAHFSSTDSYELLVPFTDDPEEATDFYSSTGGSTDIGNAVNYVIDDIDADILELRSGCEFNFILYTDGTAGNFTSDSGYDPYNSIRETPYSAITSVVRYQGQGDAQANPVAASCSTIGGSYYGGLGANTNDPDGNSLPRRLYIAEAFTDPLTDLLEDITECTLLEAILDVPCSDPVYEWIASNGGEIISYNGPFIETNEEGTYTVNILCNGECEYSGEYEYQTGGGSLVSAPSHPRGVMIDGIFLTPSQYEDYTQGNIGLPQVQTSPGYRIHIMPNPNKGAFTLVMQSEVEDQVDVSLETLSGQHVWSGTYPVMQGENLFRISESPFVDGMYLLRIQGERIRSVHKVVVTR